MVSEATTVAVIQHRLEVIETMLRDLTDDMRPMVLERQDTLSRIARTEQGVRESLAGLQAVRSAQTYNMGLAAGAAAALTGGVSWLLKLFGGGSAP